MAKNGAICQCAKIISLIWVCSCYYKNRALLVLDSFQNRSVCIILFTIHFRNMYTFWIICCLRNENAAECLWFFLNFIIIYFPLMIPTESFPSLKKKLPMMVKSDKQFAWKSMPNQQKKLQIYRKISDAISDLLSFFENISFSVRMIIFHWDPSPNNKQNEHLVKTKSAFKNSSQLCCFQIKVW